MGYILFLYVVFALCLQALKWNCVILSWEFNFQLKGHWMPNLDMLECEMDIFVQDIHMSRFSYLHKHVICIGLGWTNPGVSLHLMQSSHGCKVVSDWFSDRAPHSSMTMISYISGLRQNWGCGNIKLEGLAWLKNCVSWALFRTTWGNSCGLPLFRPCCLRTWFYKVTESHVCHGPVCIDKFSRCHK